MASLGKIFEKDVEGTYDLLPDGWYNGEIAKADVKKTKDGTGSYLNIQYKNDAGRVVFGMITITNKNSDAENIGEQQMTKLRAAIGVKRITDSDQLIGRRLAFKVSTRPARDGYDAQNEVKDWKALEGSQIPAMLPKVAPTATPAPTAAPWAKPAAAPAAEQEIF
jgi:hypothetical protein